MVVCEGMTDTLSMIEILKSWGRDLNEYKFVCLNSVTNVPKFLERYQNQNQKVAMFFCLDGDNAGNEATKTLLEKFPKGQDMRDNFGIHENGYKDMNEHLIKQLQKSEEKTQQKSRGLRR